MNNINNTLKGEAGLPVNSPEEKNEKENPDNSGVSCRKEYKKPEIDEVEDKNIELYLPEDAPAIMQDVAREFLELTGREGLTRNEISALMELERAHTPTRVLKEIEKAVKRYRKQGTSLKFLYLTYIANSLRNQNSLKQTWTKKQREQAEKATQEFGQMQTSGGVSDEEFEALMGKIHGGGKS